MTQQCGTDKNSLLLPPIVSPGLPKLPDAGNFKLFVDENGVAYIVDSTGTAVPVSPAGIDGTGALAGQVWTADGANGAAFADAPSVPYQSIVLLVTQTGTNAPSYVALQNDPGVNITMNRFGAGVYQLVSDGSIFLNQKVMYTTSPPATGTLGGFAVERFNDTSLFFYSYDGTGARADGVLANASLQIRIYP